MIIGHLILVVVAGPPSVKGFDQTNPLSGALRRIWPEPPMTTPHSPRVRADDGADNRDEAFRDFVNDLAAALQ
jgi:hypothetical protein